MFILFAKIGWSNGYVLTYLILVFVTIIIIALQMLRSLLLIYDQTFIRLPGTWMMLVNVIVLVGLLYACYYGPDNTELTLLLCAIMAPLSIASLVSNVRRTNIELGIIVTLMQFVLEVFWFLVIFLYVKKEKRDQH